MRTYELLNQNWEFMKLEKPESTIPESAEGVWQQVNLPHVWNREDAAQDGCCIYRKNFHVAVQEGKSYFLEFEAVSGVCRAFLNGVFLGEHRGGYSCFRFQMDEAVREGENRLEVIADNTRYSDINPLAGDFNNYGGIYRNVGLIETSACHFDLLYYGTSGIELDADGSGHLKISARTVGCDENTVVRYLVLTEETELVTEVPGSQGTTELTVENPRQWRGKEDPFCYTCRAELWSEGQLCDAVELDFGFREVQLDAKRGFSLNGVPMRINGVAKHQDWQGIGNGLSNEHMDRDMELIREIGANAVRLSHYQHPQYFYQLCDQEGLVTWAEIPMLQLPDGNDGAMQNAKQQLTELILQNKHHPSICIWGIQNEIAIFGESLEMYGKIEELNQMVRQLDASRISAAANLYCVKNKSQLNHITDMVGYNIYYGWYYGEMKDYTDFLEKFHRENPDVSLGISEYGVDCSLTLHSDTPKCKDYSEEFQNLYHETVYPQLEADPYLWGSFIWNMFDFGSANRNEGGVKGENRKGLVTFDRVLKKDSFYYYQACWNPNPMLHITGKRFFRRTGDSLQVKVYSNRSHVTLWVNDTLFAKKEGSRVFIFDDVPLTEGMTCVRAEAEGVEDQAMFERVPQTESSYIYIDPNPSVNVKNWFRMEEGGDNPFPEEAFSLMDSIGDVLENRQTRAVLERLFPEVLDDTRIKRRGETLLRYITKNSSNYDKKEIQSLNEALNNIKKES